MRKVFAAFLAFSLYCASGVAQVNYYANPLDVSIAEPSILKVDSTYYLYGATGEEDGISVFVSTDLIHWSRQGYCWTKTSESWGRHDFRSPEVLKVGSTYYLYYSAQIPKYNRRNICVATSSSPLGPFADVEEKALLPTHSDYGDGHPFYDSASGKFYLYFARQDSPREIQGVELTNPPIATVGGALTSLLVANISWEGSTVNAPFVHHHNGYYFLMYSGGTASSPAIAYSTSLSPLGPFTKPAANVLAKNSPTVSGPAHCAVAFSPDSSQPYMLYHTYLTPGKFERQLAIDRLQFTNNPGGPATLSLATGQPTSTSQPLPSGAVPRVTGTTDDFNLSNINRQKWNIFGEEPTHWLLGGGKLNITTQNGDIRSSALGGRNIFLQYAPESNFDLETAVSFSAGPNSEQAFLVLWQDQSNFIRLSSGFASGPVFELGTETTGTYTGTTIANTYGTNVRLKIERRANQYTGYVGSGSDGNWTQIGSTITMSAIQPQVGLGAIAPGGSTKQAVFDYLRIITATRVDDWQLY